MQHREVTVGTGGAAGDGSGATGDNLAKVCSRLGLHVFAYNSYQSLVRGGHVWLRLRIGAQKVRTHGDNLNLLIGLNQDTLDRHAREVVPVRTSTAQQRGDPVRRRRDLAWLIAAEHQHQFPQAVAVEIVHEVHARSLLCSIKSDDFPSIE